MLHADLTGHILRAFHDVHGALGVGFPESVYEQAMATVFEERGVPVVRQAPLNVQIHGRLIGEFRADLVIADSVLLELKACRELTPSHEAQLMNYLRASTLEVGLLLNFGPKPQFRRFVFANARKHRVSGGPLRGPPRSSAADAAEPR